MFKPCECLRTLKLAQDNYLNSEVWSDAREVKWTFSKKANGGGDFFRRELGRSPAYDAEVQGTD